MPPRSTTNYFDLGQNVPQLFAVPSIKDNLPPGWIYVPDILTNVELMNWQRRGAKGG